MSEKISKKEVEKTAALAKLDLSKKEVIKFSDQLASVLDNFSSVDKTETEGVEITAQVTGQKDVLVED
jgi:aspartyl/glutamyl-tRNA(Asn/Gln) amidotransferase C subunit